MFSWNTFLQVKGKYLDVSIQVSQKQVLDGPPVTGEGAGGCSALVSEEVSLSESGRKRNWIWVGLSDGTELALGQGLIIELTGQLLSTFQWDYSVHQVFITIAVLAF